MSIAQAQQIKELTAQVQALIARVAELERKLSERPVLKLREPAK